LLGLSAIPSVHVVILIQVDMNYKRFCAYL
jgi:hypothetical protein